MKRTLFEQWLARFSPGYDVTLAAAGEAPPTSTAGLGLQALPQGERAKEYIYILQAQVDMDWIPVYIGRAREPVKRWEQHLTGLAKGQKAYARWRQVLLSGQGMAKYPLRVTVVPVSDMPVAPLPNFPVTVGAVEYQLVSLAGDAYPDWLLNHEGNRR